MCTVRVGMVGVGVGVGVATDSRAIFLIILFSKSATYKDHVPAANARSDGLLKRALAESPSR